MTDDGSTYYRQCAECGQFVSDDYRPDEGAIVKECENCRERNKSAILIELEGGEITITVDGPHIKIGR